MKTLENINTKDLKQACKELNEAGICEDNIRFTGVTNAKVLKSFIDTLEKFITDADGAESKHESIPGFVVDFYNDLISDEVEEEEPMTAEVAQEEINDVTEGESTDEEIAGEVAEEIIEEQGEADLPKEIEEGFKEEAEKKKKEENKQKQKRAPKEYNAPEAASRVLKGKLVADRMKFKTFDEYAAHLRKNGPNTPTSYLDLIALDGITLKEGVALFQAYIKENDINHNGYKAPGLIYDHLNARAQRSGFIYKKEGETFTLVGMDEG